MVKKELNNKQEEIKEILKNAKKELHNFISPLNALDYYIDILRDSNEDKEKIEQSYIKAQECMSNLNSRIDYLNDILKNF